MENNNELYTEKIHVISYFLCTKGLEFTNNPYECKKTKSGYLIDRESNFGGKNTRKKYSDLMKIDSNVRGDICDTIQFHTWCLPSDVEKAKSMVLAKVKEVAKEQSEKANKLLLYLK